MISTNRESATLEIRSVEQDCPNNCEPFPLCIVILGIGVSEGVLPISNGFQGIILLLLKQVVSILYATNICVKSKVSVCVR